MIEPSPLPLELIEEFLEQAARGQIDSDARWTADLLLVSRGMRTRLLSIVYGVFIIGRRNQPMERRVLDRTQLIDPCVLEHVPLEYVDDPSIREFRVMLDNPHDPRRMAIRCLVSCNLPEPALEHCAVWYVPLVVGARDIARAWRVASNHCFNPHLRQLNNTNAGQLFWHVNQIYRLAQARVHLKRDMIHLEHRLTNAASHDIQSGAFPLTDVHLQFDPEDDTSRSRAVHFASELLNRQSHITLVLVTPEPSSDYAVSTTLTRLLSAFTAVPRKRLRWSTYFWETSPQDRLECHLPYLRAGRDPWELGLPL